MGSLPKMNYPPISNAAGIVKASIRTCKAAEPPFLLAQYPFIGTLKSGGERRIPRRFLRSEVYFGQSQE